VACSPQYRPGFIRFGNDSFALTVSTPVVDIPVPANVLQAWDRNLLATTRHFTLLLTGFQNVYPCLNADGDFTPEAVRRSTSLVFHVGLTPRRKPSKAHAQDVARAYMLVAEEKEEEAPDLTMMDDDYYMDYVSAPPPKVEEPEDPGIFERFALSHSLESLLNHNFINILRLRLRFKIAWAGAELMQAVIDRHQTRAEDVYHSHEKVL
jgi:ubiquitin-conjugating enzyme E2 Q